MSNTIINYPYNNKIIIQETGSGMYLCPSQSGVLSGVWILPAIPTQSGNLINKGYLESGIRPYNKVTMSFYPYYGSITGGINEFWLTDNVVCTGVKVGCSTASSGTLYYTSGSSGSPLYYPYTFDVYLISTGNVQQNQFRATFPTGEIYSGSGVNNIILSGNHRCGINVASGASGMTNLDIGIFGYIQY